MARLTPSDWSTHTAARLETSAGQYNSERQLMIDPRCGWINEAAERTERSG